MTKTPTVGIDLGITYSCVGVFQNGKGDIKANHMGIRVAPSYVAFTEPELIGDAAKNQVTMKPNNTIFVVAHPHKDVSLILGDMVYYVTSVAFNDEFSFNNIKVKNWKRLRSIVGPEPDLTHQMKA